MIVEVKMARTGRPPKKIDGKLFTEYYQKYISGEVTLKEYADVLGIDVRILRYRLTTLYTKGELRCFFGKNEVVSLKE